MPSANSCLLHVLVSQNIHIKRSPNGIKMDGAYFWNIWKIPEEKSTRDGARGGHEVGALLFCRKKANFRKKITAKVSGQSELRISIYTRNGETEPIEPERNREIDLISEGLLPLPCHGGQGPEGKPFSHLGRGSRKKKKTKGPPLPFSSGGAGTLPWPSSLSP